MSYRNPIKGAVFQRLRINVRVLRIAAGLTLKNAAGRAKMHWRHWQRIEAGGIDLTLMTLGRLAEALRVDVAVLLRDPEQQMH
jgi:transcriptional regulator with XRE-family HTH domain